MFERKRNMPVPGPERMAPIAGGLPSRDPPRLVLGVRHPAIPNRVGTKPAHGKQHMWNAFRGCEQLASVAIHAIGRVDATLE